MSYLCVDIEWNIPANPEDPMEALSMGAVYVPDGDFNQKVFFKYIQPEHKEWVLPSTLRLLRIGPVTLAQAKTCREVMRKLDCSFHKYDTLVIWNQEALAFLQSTMHRCGTTIHAKRIVVLQELLRATCKDVRKGATIGFQAALKRFLIPHNPDFLHISKFDALYLQQLYCAVADRLHATAEETVPLLHTPHSHILHREGCRYLEGHTVRSAGWSDVMAGEPLCKCCTRDGALRVFRCPRKPKSPPPPAAPQQAGKASFEEPFEEAEVERFCAKRNIACTVACRWIFLRTPAAHWRIAHDGYKVLAVYHENLRWPKGGKGRSKMMEGFHQQTVYSQDVFEIIDYIHRHDQRFLQSKNPLPSAMRVW